MTDTGEGIKPEFLPYVFHRFRQEESSISRKAGGLGLGLAVVRHLVELHGGSVSADSDGPGKGSTFIVELPLAHDNRDRTQARDTALDKAKPDGKATDSSPRGKLHGIRVLLVEDDDDSRSLIRVLLERRGAEVIAAASSAEAFEWFAHQRQVGSELMSEPPASAGGTADITSAPISDIRIPKSEICSLPDIIISDLGMPEEDGYELIRKIRLLSPYSVLGTQDSVWAADDSSLITHHSSLGNDIPAIALTG